MRRRTLRTTSSAAKEMANGARRRSTEGVAVDVSGSAVFSGFAETPTGPPGGLVVAAELLLASGFATVPTSPMESMIIGWISAVGVAELFAWTNSASTPTAPTEHLMHFRSVAVPDVVLVSASARTPTP